MEAEEWKANPIVWGYFIPLNFFFSLCFALFSHSSPNALWVCGTLSKAYLSKAAQKKIPMMSSSYPHCLLIILQSFYISVVSVSKLERKGRLNNPIIYNTLAAQKLQRKMCFRRFEKKVAHSSFVLLCSNGSQYPSFYQNN